MARRLQTKSRMSDKRMKEIQYRQRTRQFTDVVTVIMLAGGLAISLAGML